MPKAKFKKLHKNICVAFARLSARGGMLCRQSSQTDEAMVMGGGFIYFDGRGGQPIPPASALFLVENKLVEPVNDGLFAETSQSFKAVSFDAFHAFKERYEAPVNG